MANVAQFDLNASLSLWLDRLAQSPHVRTENVAEMETHVRDSVTRLQSQGLSEEESFLIAIRRAGSVAKLEPEFAKVNRNWLNPVIHGLILVFFSTVCGFLWGTLQLPRMMQAVKAKATGSGDLPAFTILMHGCADYLVIPPVLALIYCLYVWFRKCSTQKSWMGFFATTTAVLIFITIPTLIAVLLPLIDLLNHFPAK